MIKQQHAVERYCSVDSSVANADVFVAVNGVFVIQVCWDSASTIMNMQTWHANMFL